MGLVVEIVTPERVAYAAEDAELVAVPGVVGELGFESGHIPLLGEIAIGEVRIHTDRGIEKLAVSGGIVEASPSRIFILAETGERAEEIDADRAERARARAEKRLSSRDTADTDIERARVALLRAINRLKVSGR